MSETWRPIPGYPGYEISNHGRVLSLKRSRPHFLRMEAAREYRVVCLVSPSATRPRTVYVHHLVLLAFGGPRPADCPVVRHLDGNPHNNHVSNLAYGTEEQNRQDRLDHVKRERRPGELMLDEAANALGLSPNYVSQLCARGRIKARKIRGLTVVDGQSVATFVRQPVGRPRQTRAAQPRAA